MRTHIEFRSDKFPPYEGEEELINPDLWGKRPGEYLKDKLRVEGIETEELIPEDWGWCVPVKNDAFSLWIGCGHYQEYNNGYLCFIEPSKPFIRKFFKKIDATKEVGQIADALDSIVNSDKEITDIRWWDQDEK